MPQEEVLRQILDEINKDPAVSQRKLSSELGVSVGSINWHLKRCVSKGLVKLREVPMRRYAYYLTPDGFTEKARLTAAFLQTSFDIVRTGRQQYQALANLCVANDWTRIALIGDSELTELASLVLSQEPKIDVLCVLDPTSKNSRSAGIPVVSDAQSVARILQTSRVTVGIATRFDVLVSEAKYLDHAQNLLDLTENRILIPQFLQ